MKMNYTLYQGDCLEVMRNTMGINTMVIDAVITDPPYGISLATNYRERKRGSLARCNNFRPIEGDDKPFDPTPWLLFPTVVMFGANYYAKLLPASGAWIVWDKVDGLPSKREIGFNDNSDCELIWTNVGNAARIIRHRWMGAMKASEQTERRVHPTQKPIELMRQIIRHYTKPGDTVLDPYMGSGTTGVAALMEGRSFVGIELDPGYYEIAKRRIEQVQPALVEVTA
jgi:site-specific DNA-methyltransferase (adenine-specific)